MAKVKNPMYSSDARGAVGGIVFSRSFAGNVAKIKAQPPRRARRSQPLNRSIFSFLSRNYGQLTDEQRNSWKTWALTHPELNTFGDEFIMSGINAYMKLNSHALRIWGPGTDNDLPPSAPPVADLATLTAVAGITDPGDIDLAWTVNGAGAAGDAVEIQIAGPFQSEGLVEVFNQYRYVDDVAGNLVVDTIEGLDEGFWYWVRARYLAADGQTTPWMYAHSQPKVTV